MTEKADNGSYLRDGIIAYIGNKRRLLSLIGEALKMTAGGDLAGLHFADLFSGSGVVSRFARTLGMRVSANDWEPYAAVLGRAWLEPVPADVVRLFGDGQEGENGHAGGLEAAVDLMNRLPFPDDSRTYLARYYAPSSMNPDEADYRRERLFYTRENALRLDAARNHVEDLAGPVGEADSDAVLRRSLLLAPILYAAATHVNTSGVFKAFHKGFGGHGKDALGRITQPIRFAAPHVIDAPPGRMFSCDAGVLASGGEVSDADIVYLDPPYNQHQYGSNYHLLNTLVRWDRIPEEADLGPDGRLLRKAAIRRDWKQTRSDYCSRNLAEGAFSGLMEALKAPVVLLSYSTDGIIPFNRLLSICEAYGRLRLAADPYVTYRGGRQSAGRKDSNIEFVLMVERGRTNSKDGRRSMDRLLLGRRLQMMKNDLLRPDVLKETGTVSGDYWTPFLPGGSRVLIKTRHLVRICGLPDLENLTDGDEGVLAGLLDDARCMNRDEELKLLLEVWDRHGGDCFDLIKDVPRILRKMAHRKYKDAFQHHLNAFREAGKRHPEEYKRISGGLDRVEEVASLRFQD